MSESITNIKVGTTIVKWIFLCDEYFDILRSNLPAQNWDQSLKVRSESWENVDILDEPAWFVTLAAVEVFLLVS